MGHFLFDTLTGWIGVTGCIVIGCCVVGYLFPPLRRYAIEVGAVALAAASIYAKGNRDEARKWNDAIDHDIAKGNQARLDAERDVSDGRVRGDEWDRDKGAM